MQTGSLPSDNPYIQKYQSRQTKSGHRSDEASSAETSEKTGKKGKASDSVAISPEARAAAEAAERAAAQSSTSTSTASSSSSVSESGSIKVEVDDEKVAGVVGGDLTKRADRTATGEYYDSVLRDLRDQYGEEEAMTRFDEFMRSEGFEIAPGNDSDGRPSIYGMNRLGDYMPVSWTTMGMAGFLNEQDLFTVNRDSNLQLHSHLEGIATENGMEIYAYSDAFYRTTLSDDEQSFLDSVQADRKAAFAGQTDINLDRYFGASGANSVTGVSTELAGDLMTWFGENGIDFNNNDTLTMRLTQDEDGTFTGLEAWAVVDDVNGEDSAFRTIKKFTKEDMGDEMFDKLVSMYNSADFADAEAAGVEYDNGAQSVKVRQDRLFTFRASDPSAVVMHDNIAFEKTGHVYQKRVADAFSTEPDTVGVTAMRDGKGDMGAADLQEELQNAILDAKNSDGLVESTITKDEYDALGQLSGVSTMPESMRARQREFITDWQKANGRYIDPDSVTPMNQQITVVNYPEDFEPATETTTPPAAEKPEETKEEAAAETTEKPAETAESRRSTSRSRFTEFLNSLRANGSNRQADMLSTFFDQLHSWYNKKA